VSQELQPTREHVLALYGRAMHAAQDLEQEMIGLLGVRNELAAKSTGIPGLEWAGSRDSPQIRSPEFPTPARA
jgi:hypothetical protein